MTNPWVWPPVSGGGGWSPADGLFNWNPDLQPEAPTDDDLPFQNGAAWAPWGAEYDPGNYATWSVDAVQRAGKAVGSGNGAVRWAGQTRGIPNAEFAFVAPVALLCRPSASGAAVGIMVAENIVDNPLTAPLRTIDVAYVNGNPQLRARTWSNFGGVASQVSTTLVVPARYFRMRINGVNCDTDWSMDCRTWVQHGSVSLAWNPQRFGVAFCTIDNGVEATALFPWLQTVSGAGASQYNSFTPGRQAALPIYPP